MTNTPNDPKAAKAAALRSRQARTLLAGAARAPVELVVLSGLELCVLGAPAQVLCEEKLAAGWLATPERRRDKALRAGTEGLVHRGLLLADGAGAAEAAPGDAPEGAEVDGREYALDPALGLVLAARSRPEFVIVTALGGTEARTPRMYGLHDEQGQELPVVVELPEATPPGPFRHLQKLGVLGRLYRYVLVSRGTAADWLTEWAAKPAPEAARTASGELPARLVSVYRHDAGADFRGFTVALRTSGEETRLLAGGAPDGEPVAVHDRDGVRGIMRDLMIVGRT